MPIRKPCLLDLISHCMWWQVACASSLDELPAPLRRCFTHEIAAPAPDAAQRARLLAGFLGASAQALPPQELDEVAAQTAG